MNKTSTSSVTDRSIASKPNPVPISDLQKKYVDHSYTDYANVDEEDLRLMKESSRIGGSETTAKATKMLLGMSCCFGPMKKKGHGGSVAMPFPGKLQEVLDRGDLVDIVDWMPHGRAFIVKNPKAFTTHVLPRFFKQTKYLSFTRQLNLWGFKRITRGIDSGAYYHELFLPGRPNLTMRMKRQKIKGTGIRPVPNPDQEPKFYYNYPPVERVQRRNGDAILLPPLDPDRISKLINHCTGDDMSPADESVIQQQQQHSAVVGSHQLVPRCNTFGNDFDNTRVMKSGLRLADRVTSLQGQATNFSKVISPQKLDDTNTAMVAEFRLRLQCQLEQHSFSSLLGAPKVKRPSNNAVLPKESSASFSLHTGGLNFPPNSLHLQQSNIPAMAPQTFNYMNSVQDESFANRRLMERLLDSTSSSPRPENVLGHFKPEISLLRRPSYNVQSLGLLEAKLRGNSQLQVAASSRMESSHVHQSPSRATAAPIPSQFGPYVHQTQSMPSLPSNTSMQNVNVACLSNALRDARELEELAQSHRAKALALARTLGGKFAFEKRGREWK